MTERWAHSASNRPTGTPMGQAPGEPGAVEADEREFSFWQDRSRVFLQPIAAPSILGLFGLATATLMIGAWMAGWYGTAVTPLTLSPFLLTAGGLAQFLAGMWSYRARDGLATAVHGMWGAFWLGFGLLYLLVAMGAFPGLLAPVIGTASPPFAFWFIALCVITAVCALAAMAENMGMVAVLGLLSLASAFAAAGWFAGATWPIRVAGWCFVLSAVAALYTACAMLLEGGFRRTMLPLGRYNLAAKLAGRGATRPLEYRYGQPGVRIGQ
jgi:uncharacterized protein